MKQLQSNKEKLLNRLNELYNSLNYNDWDGYGSYPIEKESYTNAYNIIQNSEDEVLKFWIIFPSPNGTILFEFACDEIAGISVGNTGFSYAAMKDIENVMMGEYQFDLNKAIVILKEITQFLGYLF